MSSIEQYKFQQWLSEHHKDLMDHYAKALGSGLVGVDPYPAEDGVHVQLTFANKMTLDFLVPGVEFESDLNAINFAPMMTPNQDE